MTAPKETQDRLKTASLLAQSLVKMYNAANVEFTEVDREKGYDPLGVIDVTTNIYDRYHMCWDNRHCMATLMTLATSLGNGRGNIDTAP